MAHDDRDEGTDETVRQGPDLPVEPGGFADAGSADTMMAQLTSTPLPPAPPAGGTLPPTRPLARRERSAAAPPLEPGDGSRYVVGALLGQGGMGEVLLATDEHIGREVAMKRIRAAQPSTEELSRFVREARVQGRLEHPAVVPVHDLAVDRDGPAVLRHEAPRPAPTMSELLRGCAPGDEPDEAARAGASLRAFVDVCLAVEFAHSRGIIHRDLKPANIMLGDFGEVYVLDWGVARAVADADEQRPRRARERPRTTSSSTPARRRVGTVLGTPAYMAPEQLAGERAGPAADIYALGCILYEIAAGEPLHAAAAHARRRRSCRSTRGRRRSAPDSPPELDAICERAIQIDPAARYESARALGDAVQAFLDGDRDVARARGARAAAHRRGPRRARARRRRASTGATRCARPGAPSRSIRPPPRPPISSRT